MEVFIELYLSLCPIVEAGVVVCDKTNARCIPLCFHPMMIGYVTLVIFHDAVYSRNRFDVADSNVGENAMKDVIRRPTSVVLSNGLLMEFERFLMNSLIRPFDSADRLNWLIVIVEDDNIIPQVFLNGLNTMSMNDTWCNLMIGGSGVDEAKFEYFRSHRWIIDSIVFSMRKSDIRHVVVTIRIVLGGTRVVVKNDRKFRHG